LSFCVAQKIKTLAVMEERGSCFWKHTSWASLL